MKKILITSTLALVFAQSVSAQTVISIQDKALKAQQERMVITRWGNWLPKPKYFLGIQLNPNYTATWGWAAPKSKRYKEGADIRPLALHGKQTQRMGLTGEFKNDTDKYKAYTDSMARDATTEITNTSGLFSSTDPLWLLYYSKEMKGVTEYALHDVVSSLSEYEKLYLAKAGTIDWYDEQMLILQEKLNAAFNQDIDRGSRIIDYHNLLMEYRKLQQRWFTTISLANKLKNLESAMRSPHETPSGGVTRNRGSDVEIMEKIMHRINNHIE